MGTKWRNRILFALYAFVLAIGLSGPIAFIDQGNRYLHRDYYRTPDFTQQLGRFASFLNLFELNAISKQEAKSSIAITDQDIVDYRNNQGSLTDQLHWLRYQYEPLIQDAIESKNDKVAAYYKDKRDLEQANLMKLYEDDEYATTLIRKMKEQQIDRYYENRELYRAAFMNLQDQFDYYFRNAVTGVVHTNLSAQNEYTAVNQLHGDSYSYITEYRADINNSPHNWIPGHELLDASITPYRGWIAVPNTSPLKEAADRYRQEQLILFAYCLMSTILLFYCLIRFKGTMFQRIADQRWQIHYHKLPIDVRILLLAGTTLLTINQLAGAAEHVLLVLESSILYIAKLLFNLTFVTILMVLFLLQGHALLRRLRSWRDMREEWQRSIWKRCVRRIRAKLRQALNQVRDSFIYRNTGIRLLAFTCIIIAAGFIEGCLAYSFVENGNGAFFLLSPFLAIAVIAMLILYIRQFAYLNRVAQAADELVAGRMPSELPQSGNSVVSALAAHINALRRGVKTLQNEQAKSERLKTELITNVSHDLRTPLTSIITYAELLKSEDATEDERAAYVDIIDQKSKRLKTMIDDLFEVSTMASGNAKLIYARTDLVQLMHQALAEYKDVMDSSDVQFRISLPEEPIYTLADGQKLWRAFDNLIGNMVKYSLNNTRAYITMHVSERHNVMISFKNISKYEIGDNPDELFERFKRGDTSRHTEGSGLGLAIAKSIVDLHEGRLTLETDGDLFKATVTLSLESAQAVS